MPLRSCRGDPCFWIPIGPPSQPPEVTCPTSRTGWQAGVEYWNRTLWGKAKALELPRAQTGVRFSCLTSWKSFLVSN